MFGFQYPGFTGEQVDYTAVGLMPPAGGPSRFRVDWGAADQLDGDPQVTFHEARPDGSFDLYDPLLVRGYADGSYVIRVRAEFTDSLPVPETLAVFFDIQSGVGVSRTGRGIADLMAGGSGDDTFSGAGGNDWLFGGQGSDFLRGHLGDDVLNGGDGADTLSGYDGNDQLDGEGGNDSIAGGVGGDVLWGRAGDDTLVGGDDWDHLEGGDGSDRLIGGSGDDTLVGDPDAHGDGTEGVTGNDTLYGDAGADELNGNWGNDRLYGGADNDVVAGGVGDDTLVGGSGADTFFGEGGSDLLVSEDDDAEDVFLIETTGDGSPADRILGFESGLDKIWLRDPAGGSSIAADRFVNDRSAMTDNGTWVIYDSQGRLIVDLNGTDAGQQTVVARLVGAPSLSYGDFLTF
jgi:Ca2+-binding RTX toxin-like protein